MRQTMLVKILLDHSSFKNNQNIDIDYHKTTIAVFVRNCWDLFCCFEWYVIRQHLLNEIRKTLQLTKDKR